MELNVNVKIDVGDKTIGLVGTLISAARTLAGAEVKDAEAVEVKPVEVAAKAAETVETAEEKPAKARAKGKTEAKGKAKTTAQEENPDTAQNVANEMPMDDGSRKAGMEPETEPQGAVEKQKEKQREGETVETAAPPAAGAEAGAKGAGVDRSLAPDGTSTGAESRDELIARMRKAMNDCMERFIGPDYKNQTGTAKYRKYNGALKNYFLRAADSYAAHGDYKLNPHEGMKPSKLNDEDLRAFISEIDLLCPDPETGEITKSNFF